MAVKLNEVFLEGKAPTQAGTVHKSPHPANKKKTVRCIMQKRGMFFNIGDFLGPYKNPAYQIAVNVCIPPQYRNLKRIWMAQSAWEAIAKEIKGKTNKNEIQQVIKTKLAQGTLFPDFPIEKAKPAIQTKKEQDG